MVEGVCWRRACISRGHAPRDYYEIRSDERVQVNAENPTGMSALGFSEYDSEVFFIDAIFGARYYCLTYHNCKTSQSEGSLYDVTSCLAVRSHILYRWVCYRGRSASKCTVYLTIGVSLQGLCLLTESVQRMVRLLLKLLNLLITYAFVVYLPLGSLLVKGSQSVICTTLANVRMVLMSIVTG